MLLWSWAALSPLLFRLLPGRDAAIACLVFGWAFLPVADRPSAGLAGPSEESSVHAVAVPTSTLVNKATAIGLGCLAGLVLFDRRTLARLRFARVDVPMVAWCLVPLASSAANGLPLSEGLAQARYLALAWGVPYLMGRAYLVDAGSRARFAVGLAASGLAYVPICLLEIIAGPAAYRFVYGFHPYEFEGAARSFGYRPLGFQEHGNQLGIWMASSALAATWIWASGAVRRPGGVPGGVLAACLIGVTLLCQSHSSILLLGLALLPLLVAHFSGSRVSWRWVSLAGLGFAFLAIFLFAASKGFNLAAIRLGVGGFFKGMGKSSFTWRMARTGDYLPIVLQHPWLGWARADWRPKGLPFVNPVNLPLWLLVPGMYGLVGLAALAATWLVPLARAVRAGHLRSWFQPSRGATGALVAVVAINALDSFSNSVVILPILAAVGALARSADRRKNQA
jgi:hypothetical protein